MNTNCFSIRRFGHLLRATAREEGRTVLLYGATVVVLLFLSYLFFTSQVNKYERTHPHERVSYEYVQGADPIQTELSEVEYYATKYQEMLFASRATMGFTLGFLWMALVSMSFRGYFRKGYASAKLMLPAARSEKFALRLIFALVVAPLVLGLFYFLHDWAWSTSLGVKPFFPYLLDNVVEQYHYIGRAYNGSHAPFLTGVHMLFWAALNNFALFWFGAIFFRRRQLVYTMFAVFIATVIFSTGLGRLLERTFDIGSNSYLVVHLGVTNLLILLVGLLWTGGFIYGSWRLFSRLQITK